MSGQSQGKNRHFSTPEALGQSEAFFEFQEKISKVAPIERPVLILGERGTGKELAALRIHFLSKRWQKPLVTMNCSALTPGLIGSELFGYEKGAFTGAVSRQAGRFEKASEGTLFLDEIGTIPTEVQEKILRVVEYGSFERLGSSEPIHVDVRIVAATNADLPLMVKSGEFKQDLLDRLSFEALYVPPLRNRRGDIKFLARHFASRMAFELGWDDMPEISSSALKLLETYEWPGNIRELKNVVERAVYKSSSGKITQISFNPFDTPYKKSLENNLLDKKNTIPESKPDQSADAMGHILTKPFKEAVCELEYYLLSNALNQSLFNQKKAAQMLGLSYDQFRGIKKKYAHRI